MSFQDPYAKISRNASSAESERLSQVCCLQSASCTSAERPIDDRIMALILLVGFAQTNLNEGRITKDQFDKIMNELAANIQQDK